MQGPGELAIRRGGVGIGIMVVMMVVVVGVVRIGIRGQRRGRCPPRRRRRVHDRGSLVERQRGGLLGGWYR